LQVENLLPKYYLRKVNVKKAKYFVNQGRKFLWGLLCGITIKDIPFNGETINEALHPTKVRIRNAHVEYDSCQIYRQFISNVI
jgi:hypothetical protein